MKEAQEVMMMIRKFQRFPLAATIVATAALSVGCGSEAQSSSTQTAGSTAPSETLAPPTGEVLFNDDFVDDSNHWGVVDDPEFGSASFVDGDYVWEFRGSIAHWLPGALIDQYDAGTLDALDVHVSAELTILEGGGVAGVFCRENPDSDAEWQWYEFVVRDGYAAIRLSDQEGNIEALAENRDIALPLGTPIAIDASCLSNDAGGVDLAMTVNGATTLTATVEDDALTNGAPGLSVWTFPLHEQMDIVWHSFTVRSAA